MAFKNLSEEVIEEINQLLESGVTQKEIAKRFDISQSDVSRIKTKTNYHDKPSLRVWGVSAKTKEALQNIAKNKGLNFSSYMKMEIHQILDRTPDKLKNPLKD